MAKTRKIGRLMLGASLLVLTSEALPEPSVSSTDDFCTRLGTTIGIAKPSDGRTTWTASPFTFGQRFFGGSAAIAVAVSPVEPATVADYRKLEPMCLPNGKGAVCKLIGPVNFHFTWKGQTIVTPMSTGERATVSVLGTKTTCQSETP